MSKKVTASVHLNNELEAILTSSTEEPNLILNMLRNHFHRLFLMRFCKWTIVPIFLFYVFFYIQILNWNVTAIGRLFLIKNLLPIYDWENWSNARCMIPIKQIQDELKEYGGNNKIIQAQDECTYCEHLLHIDRKSNTSYNELQSRYLWRDLPIIITDSHKPWSVLHIDEDFIDFLQKLTGLMESNPCNVASNLFRPSSHFSSVQKMFKQIYQLPSSENWFLNFRNCHFKAVKSSRAIVSYQHRPYFLSPHLPPFHSSWILVSYDYEMIAMKQLHVINLVVVMQLEGSIYIKLAAKEQCTVECTDHEFKLSRGESLIFIADKWNIFYEPTNVDRTLVATFVQEIEWD